MKPRFTALTIGVDDLERSLAFYRDGLGLQTSGVIGTEFKGDETHPSGKAVMSELRNEIILTLYSHIDLAKDANRPVGPPSPTGFSISHFVQN